MQAVHETSLATLVGRLTASGGARPRRPVLFRAAQRRNPALAPWLAVLYLATALPAYAWTTSTDGLAALWLGNGVLAAAFLLLPPGEALAVATLGFSVDLGCCLAVAHIGPVRGVLVAGLDLVEAMLAAVLVRRWCGAAPDPVRVRRLRAMILCAVLPATLATGALYTAVVGVLYGENPARQLLSWFGGDFLSMIIALPAILLIARIGRRPDRARVSWTGRAWISGLILVVTATVFAQAQAEAFLFLVPLLALLATFRLNAPLVAAVNVMVAFVASGLTIAGVGPIAAAEPHDVGSAVLVLELFLAVVALSSLLASALLAERDRAQRRLTRSLAAARAARAVAVEAARAKTRFLAVMSHEMRTPLNGVLGYAQILGARADLPERAREQVASIAASGQALACLVDDILDFSRLDADRFELDPTPFDLAAVVERVGATTRQLLRDSPVALSVEIDPGCRGGHVGDERRLAQVLLHLARNAVKFTETGRIVIEARTTPVGDQVDRCRLAVRDTGIGLSAKEAERVFEPFQQSDGSTTRKYGGAGLGLSIVRSLVALMGGEVGVSSRPGEGSEFWISLSLRRSDDTTGAEQAPAPPEADGLRVLLVDDHPVNREVAHIILTALGCDVTVAADGRAAVEAAAMQAFDLVFMDVHMPGMDGLEAARAIRGLPGPAASTPVLALTAAAADEDIARCRAAGMDGHVKKPVDIDTLAQVLASYARLAGNGMAEAAA